MIKKWVVLFYAMIFCISSPLVANLTTMQWWDPSPIYSATNFMMPSHTHIHSNKKLKLKNVDHTHNSNFGASVSFIAQGACRARDHSGCNEFGSVCGAPAHGQELGDFQGTLYPFGIFLGNNPDGKSIWANGIDNEKITNITPDSINAMGFPRCVRDNLKQLSGNFDADTGLPTASGGALTTPAQALMVGPIPDLTVADAHGCIGSVDCMDCDAGGGNPGTGTDACTAPCIPGCVLLPLPIGPSVFSEQQLKEDTKCFGSYSLPLEYKKYAFRIEMHANVNDNVGITMQTGFANIKQKKVESPFVLTNAQIDGTNCDNIYPNLTFQGVNGDTGMLPNIEHQTPTQTVSDAQRVFDIFFTKQLDNILGSDCGISQSLKDFDEYSMEDFRMFLTFSKSHGIKRFLKDEDEDHTWPEMLFTGYGWAGGSFPVGEKRDYTSLLSLPFGNNGHVSLGGGVGLAYDFVDMIELGAELGFAYFLSKEEIRPFPNHKLQRGIYPFHAQVTKQPGVNWHFKALMNAYQCMPHVNFWASYEFIEHGKDEYSFKFDNTVTKVNPDTNETITERLFIPEVLECLSDWRAQFINIGVIFDVNPGMQASLAWQQPITPRNAYYPVSIVASFSLTF